MQFCHEVESLVGDYPQVADYSDLLKYKGIQSFEDLKKNRLVPDGVGYCTGAFGAF